MTGSRCQEPPLTPDAFVAAFHQAASSPSSEATKDTRGPKRKQSGLSKPPKPPTVYVIAGPNGPGKTTFALQFLPDFVRCTEFLNADLME